MSRPEAGGLAASSIVYVESSNHRAPPNHSPSNSEDPKIRSTVSREGSAAVCCAPALIGAIAQRMSGTSRIELVGRRIVLVLGGLIDKQSGCTPAVPPDLEAVDYRVKVVGRSKLESLEDQVRC